VELWPKLKKAREQQTTRRASDKGCLFMSLDQYLQYLQLLYWATIASGQAGSYFRGSEADYGATGLRCGILAGPCADLPSPIPH